MNSVQLIGILTRSPTVRFEGAGVQLCTSSRNFLFAIALTSRWRKGEAGGGWYSVRADDGVDVVS